MRFSLKWLLAAMAYVALAAVALTQRAWYFADALNVVTAAAIVYAATLAILARGKAKGAAIGFVLAAVFNLGTYYLAPAQTITARIASYLSAETPAQPPTPQGPSRGGRYTSAGGTIRYQGAPANTILVGTAPIEVIARAASASMTMLTGLIGAALGALAARHAVVEQKSPPSP